MLASSIPIDLVFILTADQFHAENIIECANAGKHVMIEKPMAQTLAEYDAVEEARVKNGVVVFVGYMRRYAPALDRLKEEIKGKTIKYVRVRDIIGNVGTLCLPVTDYKLKTGELQNSYFTSQSGMHQHYYKDLPSSASSELIARRASNLKENLGAKADSDPRSANSWALLHSLGSHDLSAMRDVIGMPEKCLCATRSDDGDSSWWWTALFQYRGFKAYYEVSTA